MSEQLRERFEALRAQEFRRLDEYGHVYLDYTGSGLYAESQLRRQEEFLERHVLGNPHSENPTSQEATRLVENARREVLDFFGADPADYVVAFAANASAALKLVGESYPFAAGSRFVLMQDAHNSVVGIREYARARGGEVVCLGVDGELRLESGASLPPAGKGPSLFAFPAQSNFSGVQHPLGLVAEAKAAGYDVLLDAAAFVPTNALDLGRVPADFVCVSFYKMFGFPTGVGALLARREALARLQRPWFGGGTVEYVSVQNGIHQLRVGAEAFEDGTLNFLGIAAVPQGLDFLRSVGIQEIHRRVVGLTGRLLEILTSLRHGNGGPAVALYGPRGTDRRGGTVAFNLLDPGGAVVPYGVVERAASREKISLRGGCFCNPGAAEAAFGLPAEDAFRCFTAMPRGTFSLKRLADCLGNDLAVGALRASVGIATDDNDLDRLDSFLRDFVARGPSMREETAAAEV
ncbi:MAG TPA: aminotransferase class V-fold PLP-dependent enzyme [Longimicrobiales bacterium]|nr:aminotransferase class V-fold PLP-dependent enzyme [Longimicrobiales bacterium]